MNTAISLIFTLLASPWHQFYGRVIHHIEMISDARYYPCSPSSSYSVTFLQAGHHYYLLSVIHRQQGGSQTLNPGVPTLNTSPSFTKLQDHWSPRFLCQAVPASELLRVLFPLAGWLCPRIFNSWHLVMQVSAHTGPVQIGRLCLTMPPCHYSVVFSSQYFLRAGIFCVLFTVSSLWENKLHHTGCSPSFSQSTGQTVGEEYIFVVKLTKNIFFLLPNTFLVITILKSDRWEKQQKPGLVTN